MTQPIVTLARWSGHGPWQSHLSPETRQDVEEVVREMANDWCSLLTIEVADRSLLVNASRGIFTVTALLGPDEFYDLLAEEPVEGTVSYAQGGQVVDLPLREALGPGRALEAATEFFSTGTVDLSRGRWRQQV